MNLNFNAAVNATQGVVFDAVPTPAPLRVVTDTRALVRGDTFLALRGERFNGHDYVAEAIAKGAAAIVIDDAKARVVGTPTVLVADSLVAYMALAGLARNAFNGHVIAITGSSGKTTTKALLAQLLMGGFGTRVLASPGNENNEIGVSKLLLDASNAKHDVLVIEMGARHFGDIAALVDMAHPHIGVLTNIGEAHLEIMGSRERLAQTKWGLFAGGARAVLNVGDAQSRNRAAQLEQAPHWFAAVEDEAELAVEGRYSALFGTARFVDRTPKKTHERRVEVRLPGAHNRANLAAALAGALELGVDIDALAVAIPTLVLPEGRFDSIDLPSGVRLIFDAYNANLSGAIATLDAFVCEPGDRRIAVLGSMAELGEEAPMMHELVGAHAAASGLDWLLLGGDFAREMARGALDAGFSPKRIVAVATNHEAAEWLREHACAGDVVLLKGSRKYKLEEIVAELRA